MAGAAEQEAVNATEEVLTAAEDGGSGVTKFANRAAARQAFSDNPPMQTAANKFFRGATGKSQDFQVADLGNGQYKLQFFSPANNPGYGKLYIQTINNSGATVNEYKDTLGPSGIIERKPIFGEIPPIGEEQQ
jgi:hypothetical protein